MKSKMIQSSVGTVRFFLVLMCVGAVAFLLQGALAPLKEATRSSRPVKVQLRTFDPDRNGEEFS